MISTIKALDFLCSNKGVEQYAMNDLVYFTLFKILKSQDWNAVYNIFLKIFKKANNNY